MVGQLDSFVMEAYASFLTSKNNGRRYKQKQKLATNLTARLSRGKYGKQKARVARRVVVRAHGVLSGSP